MKRITALLPLFLLLFSASPMFVVQANEKVGYSVQAELAESQLDRNLSYFDLRVKPNQEQKLAVTVYNLEEEEITIRSAIYNASTNSNGLIVYEEQEKTDSSLKQPITELVTLEEEEFTVQAGESKTVTAILETPQEEFNGVKLGGIYFEKEPEEQEAEQGVTIQNKYAYVIGLKLSENDQEIVPKLGLVDVQSQLVNHRPAVVARIQNSQPLLMEDVTIKAKVYEENSSKSIRETKQEGIQMAPNSTMDFVIDWNNEQLQAGTYQLKITATAGKNEWKWQEQFSISKEDEVINDNAVGLEDSTPNFVGWYITGILGLLVIILFLITYIRRLKKEK